MGAARTVLYIEDNPTNVLLVERVLALRPLVRLHVAFRGDIGVETAAARHPDLILLDLHLPDMSGEQVLRRLRADPATRDIPVVIVSADAMAEGIARLRAAGAAGYLTKPFDLGAFLAVIDAVPAPPTGSKPDQDSEESLDPELIAVLRALPNAPRELRFVIHAYEQDTTAGLGEVAAALNSGDLFTVAALAHRLKGSSASLGAVRLASLLAELERRVEELTAEEARRLSRDIEEEFRRAATALRAVLTLT